jgi:hypothetical protein
MTTAYHINTSASSDAGVCTHPLDALNLYLREAYRRLHNLTKRYGYAWACNAALGKLFGKSAATAERYIKWFRDNGYIRTEYDAKTHTRRIFCLVQFPSKKTGNSSKNEEYLRQDLKVTPVVPLPYIEIPKETPQHPATPLPVPDPPASPVVVSPDSEWMQKIDAFLGEDEPVTPNCQEILDSSDDTKPTPDAEHPIPEKVITRDNFSQPPIPTSTPKHTTVTLHPPRNAAESQPDGSIVSTLIAHGISPATARQLAADKPDECRYQIRHFDTAKHGTGWLIRAIQQGYRHTPPKMPPTAIVRPAQRPQSPAPTPEARQQSYEGFLSACGGLLGRGKREKQRDD